MEIAYLDSSVILRVLLDEPNQLKEFRQVTHGISSQIVKLECLRTLDRFRIQESLKDNEISELRQLFFKIYNKLTLVSLTQSVLDFACQPYGFPLKSLDAIHLVSCQNAQVVENKKIPLFTHDHKLGIIARAIGIDVFGCR